MTQLVVLNAGPATTVQDAGRWRWQHLGVSPAGFADPLLAGLANALVGNPPDAAVLEWTLRGDTLQVVGGPIRVAVAAWADVRVDNQVAPTFRSLRLHAGQVLSVGALTVGRHGVLAVAGGLQTPQVLGSRAVHARSALGGSPLQDGMLLPVLDDRDPHAPDTLLPFARVPLPVGHVRVLPAPQAALFATDAMARLTAQPWQIMAGDRMGLRLQGPPLPLRPGVEPVSEGVVTGALQVPPSGQPILLGPDRQTMGGYAKLAVVISADLRHIAHRRDGESLTFIAVADADAKSALTAAAQAQAELVASIAIAHDLLPFESPRLLRLLS